MLRGEAWVPFSQQVLDFAYSKCPSCAAVAMAMWSSKDSMDVLQVGYQPVSNTAFVKYALCVQYGHPERRDTASSPVCQSFIQK